ncbi:MAG: type IV pilus twitching motility protein PilT [Thermodesulfovibrionales bacterium]|jgi:twitching motility protein PilT
MRDIDRILKACVDRGASDIHLTVNKPPVLRIDGCLVSLDEPSLTRADTEAIMKSITSEEKQHRLAEKGGAEFGLDFTETARFRVSVYKQKGTVGLALRLIPSRILSLDEIGLPQGVKELLYKQRGLILVTGPTGCGKTTTLAAMVDFINTNRDCHIITIEDPIEYCHEHKKSIVTQREIGADVPDFSDAIVRSLRQDPDVIFVGEMRDLATIEAAVRAAETGHLVLSTLHTVCATNTVDRIIDVFPPHQQDQIRIQLASSLLAIIAQRLLPRATGKGRIAVFEFMISTPSIQSYIRDKKTFRIISDIQTGGEKHGMKTFDTALAEMYHNGAITFDTVMSNAFDPPQLRMKILEDSGAK